MYNSVHCTVYSTPKYTTVKGRLGNGHLALLVLCAVKSPHAVCLAVLCTVLMCGGLYLSYQLDCGAMDAVMCRAVGCSAVQCSAVQCSAVQ